GLAAQVPAAMEQLPADLKRDEGLAGAGGERQQDALAVLRDGLHHSLDRDVLVVAAGVGAPLVLERYGCEAVPPGVGFGESECPELVRSRIARVLPFFAGLHVDAIDALAVRAIGEP